MILQRVLLAAAVAVALSASSALAATKTRTATPAPPPARPPAAASAVGLLDVSIDAATQRAGKLLVAEVAVSPSLPPVTALTVHLDGKAGVAFATSADGRRHRILCPIDVETRPGKPLALVLEAVLADGRRAVFDKPVAIGAGGYDVRSLTVSTAFTSPSRADKRRAKVEARELSAALTTTSPDKLWRGTFLQPTPGEETSPFGTLRTYNKKKRSRHLGLDLDGDTGAPIIAANRGRVLLAKNRFYSGGTVVLDHGQGLITMYFHMSRIDVEPGMMVDKGRPLGAVGASGQVTGPHLHLSVKLANLYLNPAQLLALPLDDDRDMLRGAHRTETP